MKCIDFWAIETLSSRYYVAISDEEHEKLLSLYHADRGAYDKRLKELVEAGDWEDGGKSHCDSVDSCCDFELYPAPPKEPPVDDAKGVS